jgi:hypothetical protein
MQLLDVGMCVRWIGGSGSEPDEHAHAMFHGIGGQQLTRNAWRNLFPFRFRPVLRGCRQGNLAGLRGDTLREAVSQRLRRAQHIGGP